MSGGWVGSDRRSRLPDDWPDRVAETKRLAGGRCEEKIPGRNGGRFRCSAPGTDVDHIIAGDDHSVGNRQLLCARHHSLKSSKEGNEAKAVIRSTGRRTPERHPSQIRRRPT